MADDVNSEIIGGIGISITGDYSDLKASYSQAQSDAAAAGQAVAGAFNDGVDSVASAGTVVSEALTGIGEAADSTDASLGNFSEAAEAAGESSGQAAGTLGEMAEQLTAIGEALVITEGLSEFGSEALSAADSITTASIALTKFTGDANETQETIEGLESLGMADGLSMPSLLTASQRMTALLPEGTDVVSVLGQIADGAAVMGTDVGTAANAFDRIVASGSVNARQLVQIGQSLETLSTAFNVVTGGANSTASSVAAMMKSLDDEGRIAVLTQSLSVLGGTAEQVAEQTFGGQWQQLANAWESTMVQVGQALLPVISDLTAFAKTDVLPFIQNLVSDFNSLPGPIKDVVVGIGLLAAAVIPLTGLAAAAAIGLNGIVDAATKLGIISGESAIAEDELATATEGVAAAAIESIPELDEQAIAIEGVGVAAEESAIQYDLFAHSAVAPNWSAEAQQLNLFAGAETEAGEGAAGMGASMGAAAVGGVLVLAGALGSLFGAYEAWKTSSAQQVQQTAALMDTVNSLSAALQRHGVEFQSLNDQYNNGQITLQELVSKLQALDAEWQNSISVTQNAANNSVLLAGALQTLTEDVQKNATAYTSAEAVYGSVVTSLQTQAPLYKSIAAGVDALMQAQEGLISSAAKTAAGMSSATVALTADALAAEKATFAYQAQSGAYQQVLSAYNAGNATLGQVDAAFTKLQSSEAAAATAGVPIVGSLQAIAEQANAAVNSTNVLATSQGIAADQAKAQSDALSDDDAQVLILSQKLDLLVAAQDQMAQKVAAGTAQYSQQIDIQKQVVTVSQQLTDAQNQAATAALNQGNAAAIAGGDIGVLKQELDAANLNLQQMTDKADAGTVSITAWAGAQKAAQTEAMNLSVAAAEDAADVGKATDSYDLAAASAAGAAAKLAFLTQAFKDNKASISDVDSAQSAYITTQVKLAEQLAVSTGGLQGATDAYSLQSIAVEKAQGDVDAYKKLEQQGIDVASQLQSAQSALTSAQEKLNGMTVSATADTGSLTDAEVKLYGAMGSLPPALSTVSSGLASVNTQAQSVAASLNDVAAAVKGIEADAQSAFGSGSGSQSVSAPAGYTASEQFLPGIMGGGSEIVTWVPDAATIAAQAKAYEQQLYDQGYTPVAIAAKTTMPLAQVLADLGLTAAQATITESQAKNTSTSSAGNVVLDPNQPVLTLPGSGTTGASSSTGSGTTVSTGSTVSTSSGSSPAIDGGSYPAVTAHQASGEVWAVSGTASAGGSSSIGSSISTTINNSVTGASAGSTAALTGATQAVGGAVQQLATTQGPIATSAEVTAQAAAQIATAVGGLVVRLNAGTTGTASGGTTGATGGGGTAYPTGAPSMTVAGGNPQGSIASSPTASSPPYNPSNPLPTGIGGTVTNSVSVNIDARGSMGLNTQAIVNQVTAAVSNTLVGQLRSSGARF